jgi:hypothetical protein
VLPAICIPDLDQSIAGDKCDGDDFHFGEFAMNIYATTQSEADAMKTVGTISTQAITITASEPPVGLMVLFGAVVVGLFKLVRRTA